MDVHEDGSDSDPYETTRIADTPETRETANESLRSMYSSNRTADDSKIDDIMVIDVLGDTEKAPTQSTPMKKVGLRISFTIAGSNVEVLFSENCQKEKGGI